MSPTSQACHDLRTYMARDAAYIGPFDIVYEALFGPFQHDAHVTCRTAHIKAGSLTERLRRADDALRAECARMSEGTAQRLAEAHGYDTAALRRMYDQYATGCFSTNWNAAAQCRITRRALDIAIEFQGGAHSIAAE